MFEKEDKKQIIYIYIYINISFLLKMTKISVRSILAC